MLVQSGMGVERAAAWPVITDWGDAEACRFEHSLCRMVHLTLPGIHDAPGEEVDIGA